MDLRATAPMLALAAIKGLRRDFRSLLPASGGALLGLAWVPAFASNSAEGVTFGLVFLVFVSTTLAGGLAFVGLRAARGGEVSARTLLRGFWPPRRWLTSALAGTALGLGVGLGLVLLVVPGLYLLSRLIFSLLFIGEQDLSAVAAMRASWALTRGHELALLAFIGVSAVLVALGLVCCIVGAIPVLALLAVAWGRLFDTLREDQLESARRG